MGGVDDVDAREKLEEMGDVDHRDDIPVPVGEVCPDEEIVGDAAADAPEMDSGGDVGISMPSNSLASRTISLSDRLISSIEGKKFLKRASACHFDAFLNSIQTSMRPGRLNAGSRRSM